jgi:hypothetical protein
MIGRSPPDSNGERAAAGATLIPPQWIEPGTGEIHRVPNPLGRITIGLIGQQHHDAVIALIEHGRLGQDTLPQNRHTRRYLP